MDTVGVEDPIEEAMEGRRFVYVAAALAAAVPGLTSISTTEGNGTDDGEEEDEDRAGMLFSSRSLGRDENVGGTAEMGLGYDALIAAVLVKPRSAATA